jgi:uncharacterized membrane protein YkoI
MKTSSLAYVLGLAVLAGTGLTAVTSSAQLRDDRLTRQLLQGLPAQPRSATASATSPTQAARIAQQRHGGEVLAVESMQQGYRVKLLVNGEVKIVTLDD